MRGKQIIERGLQNEKPGSAYQTLRCCLTREDPGGPDVVGERVPDAERGAGLASCAPFRSFTSSLLHQVVELLEQAILFHLQILDLLPETIGLVIQEEGFLQVQPGVTAPLDLELPPDEGPDLPVEVGELLAQVVDTVVDRDLRRQRQCLHLARRTRGALDGHGAGRLLKVCLISN